MRARDFLPEYLPNPQSWNWQQQYQNHPKINEAITLSKYEPTVVKSINTTILQVLKNLNIEFERNNYEWLALNDEITRTGSLTPANKKLENFLYTDIRSQLKQKLNQLLNSIFPDNLEGKFPIKLEFEDIDTPGHAENTTIVIDNSLIKNISTKLVRKIDGWIFDWYTTGDNENLLSEYLRILSDDDAMESFFARYYSSNQKNIKNLASTFIHELVHTIQHQKQFEKNRHDIEYRSYLDKHKHQFRNMIQAKQQTGGDYFDNELRNLHATSPQEIDAFAHEIALKILNDWDINQLLDVKNLGTEDLNDIMRSVPEYITIHWKKPSTPTEQKIFKRYVNKTMAQLRDYFDHTDR